MIETTVNSFAFEKFIKTLSKIKIHELSIVCNNHEALIKGYNNRFLVELLEEKGYVITNKPFNFEITSLGTSFFEYFKNRNK